MGMRRIATIALNMALALALSLALGCAGQSAETQTDAPALAEPLPTDYAQLGERLSEAIPARMEEHGATSISVAVVHGQEIVYAETFGLASREGEQAASPETVYEIGSISKPFIGLAVMQLVEAGALDLDAPIDQYLPEFEIQSRFEDTSAPTLRQLLSHRAGIPSDLAVLEDPNYTPAMLPELLRDEWLTQPPGHAAVYSNVGADLAALVVERTVERDYGEYLEAEVLAPLGMGGASIRLTDAQRAALATGYDGGGNAATPITYKPCGSIRATATQLAQLVKWVNGRGEVEGTRLLTEASVDEMLRAQNADAAIDLGAQIGLGWFIRPGSEASGDIVHHNGATGGFFSDLRVSLDHRVGVVVLGNQRSPAVVTIADEAMALAVAVEADLDLLAELDAVDPVPPPTSAELTPERLDAIAAHDYSDGTTHLHFERRRGQLHAKLRGRQSLRLIPRDDGTFDLQGRLFGMPVGQLFPGHRVSHEVLDGDEVLVARGPHGAWVFARRYEPGPITEAWRGRAGTYLPVGPAAEQIERVELHVEDAGVRVDAYAKGQKHPLPFVLEVHSDTLATVAGHGRRSGGAVVVESREGKTVLRAQGMEFVEARR